MVQVEDEVICISNSISCERRCCVSRVLESNPFCGIMSKLLWGLASVLLWSRFVLSNDRTDLSFVKFTSSRCLQIIYNSTRCHFPLLMQLIGYRSRSQWPRGPRRRSAAARQLRSWVRIPPGAWIFVCCECCVLSGRGLCDELITRPEESYRLW